MSLSGKQALLHLLQKYSQSPQDRDSLSKISDEMRIGFLLHGSTAADSWFDVERIAWISKTHPYGSVSQGLGLRGTKYLLSEILYAMIPEEGIPETVAQEFPDISKEEYDSAARMMFLLLNACEFCSTLESVENGGKLDMEALEQHLYSYLKKLAHFRKDPGDYVGATCDDLKEEYRARLNRIRGDEDAE